MKKTWICLILALGLMGAASRSSAAGLIVVDDAEHLPIPQPIPIPPDRPGPSWHPIRPPWHEWHRFAPLEVDYEKVQTHITDQIALTSVDEQFHNPNPQRLEGTFIFPIPKGAQIDKFTMEIDGKQAQAELLAADKARGIYEDIVRRMRDPALMEYEGRDVLKVRIFPIEPNSDKRITLSYTQVLKSDSGMIDYVLPLSESKYSAKPIKTVSVKVDVETKRPLKSIYSPSHAVEVHRDGSNRATAGYEASDVQPDTDFQLYFAPEKDEIGLNLMTYRSSGDDGFFLLLASPGMDVKQKAVPKDVVFVLDTSGSMAGDKIKQAKKALAFCVDNLNDNDRFELIRFSTEVEPLFNQLVDASSDNRAKATSFIKDLKAIGATAIDDALRQALKMNEEKNGRPFVVIFLTDGMPTIGTTDEEQIVSGVRERSKGRSRVFCFGIGTDVNTHLLDKIAEETRAFSQYVLPEEDIEVKVSNFFTKIKEPVLADPSLNFTADIHASKLYPSPLPDLFKGEQLLLVGRYSGHGSSAAIIEGTVNGESKKFSYDVKFPEESSEHDFIPRLWATRRVGYLMDQIRLHGENSELRDEVTDLARKYGIVTPYTAYLIVEDEKQHGIAMNRQSLSTFAADAPAQAYMAQRYRSFEAAKDGAGAVLDSRAGTAMKMATVPSGGMGGRESSFSYGFADSLAPSATGQPIAAQAEASRVVQYSQETRFAGGRNFFRNGEQWIDPQVQRLPNAKRIRIEFATPEYYTLVKTHPETAPWLALGSNVQFVLDGSVYEIFDKLQN
jgi:Ca-activated chloride channel homolog